MKEGGFTECKQILTTYMVDIISKEAIGAPNRHSVSLAPEPDDFYDFIRSEKTQLLKLFNNQDYGNILLNAQQKIVAGKPNPEEYIKDLFGRRIIKYMKDNGPEEFAKILKKYIEVKLEEKAIAAGSALKQRTLPAITTEPASKAEAVSPSTKTPKRR